ncbi:MAG: DNA polymerase III subunit gamma/tau C-terminal domain-containing protein, partial [Woeseia sp.]
PSRKDTIANALTRQFGEELRVEIEIGNSAVETPVQADARIADEQLEAARQSLEDDPNVKALQDMFGATLNPDSVEIVSRDKSANQEH